MKLALIPLAAASAALLAPVLTSGAEAQYRQPQQDYRSCEQARQDRQIAGALIGGLLGAVVGNELADDDDHRRYDRHDRRYRGYDRYDRRHYRYDRRHHSRHHDDGDETAATLVGAGLGAVIGAGVAGGEDCGPAYKNQGHNAQYGYQDSYGYGADYGYDDRQLAGGYDQGYAQPGGQGGVYQAGYGQRCEWRSTGGYDYNGAQSIYMCQGSDGIWRPADAY